MRHPFGPACILGRGSGILSEPEGVSFCLLLAEQPQVVPKQDKREAPSACLPQCLLHR